jgi:hypothetical protein
MIILLGWLRGGLDDGWQFLFGIDKAYIGDRNLTISRSDLWNMHNGVWSLFLIALGIAAGTIHAVRLWRTRNNQNGSEHDGGLKGLQP